MMAKKAKVELTLEELQAKKSKRQRGWVRFCAVLLAVVLTLGIFGLASQGDPNVVKVYPNVVRAQTKTVVQKQDSTPATSDSTDSDENTTTPTAPSTKDEGSILDTLLGLLGGLDLSGIASGIVNGVGVAIPGIRDSLLSLIDKLEASISGKPAITHEAVEYAFPSSVEAGDEAVRADLVAKLNAATQNVTGYSVERFAAFSENGHVNIGEQTETVNKILSAAGISLDSVVGEFAGAKTDGAGEPTALTFTVQSGQTAAEAVAQAGLDASCENYALMATQLTADDIAVLKADAENGLYSFRLKNVDNPNRRADCGLTRFTNDYLVQNELADRVANAVQLTQVSTSTLKLIDLETKYSNITVNVAFDPTTGNLKSLEYFYESYNRFAVRTNTVQVVGTAGMMTQNTYTDFVY